MDNKTNIEITTYLTIAVTLIVWASSFSAIRYGLQSAANPTGFSPGPLALFRFGTAAIVAIGYLVVTKKPFPAKEDLPRIMLAGFFGFTLYHVLLNSAEQTVQAGAAAVIIAASPIFTALMSTVFLKERLTVWGWVGIGFSFLGVIFIALSGSGGFGFDPNALLLVVCAFATASYMVLSKKPLQKYPGIQFTSYAIIAGTIPMLFFAPSLAKEMQVAHASSIIAIIYLGIFPGFLAYGLWNVVLSKMPTTALAVFLNFQPLSAAGIAWAWLGEIPTALTWAGGVAAITGVFIVQRFGERDWHPGEIDTADVP